MSLDPRSRERLEALGRRLPQPLPAPEPRRQPSASEPRHAVEVEQNPEQLFRELMTASQDGSVPPHLLDRLRQLERTPAPRPSASATQPASPGRRSSRQAAVSVNPDQELYEAFEDLLSLSEDGPDSDQPSARRSPGGPQRPAPRTAQPPRRQPGR